jgi:hypothetical protein
MRSSLPAIFWQSLQINNFKDVFKPPFWKIANIWDIVLNILHKLSVSLAFHKTGYIILPIHILEIESLITFQKLKVIS